VPGSLELDMSALARNYHRTVHCLKPGTRVIASVKANAYGHGAIEVSRALEALGVYALATGSLAEAKKMRASGIESPILLLGGQLSMTAPEIVKYGLTPSIYDLEVAAAISAATSSPYSVYIKVDAGFGRLGVLVRDAPALIRELAALPKLSIRGIFTHLPFDDADGESWARECITSFSALLGKLKKDSITFEVTQVLSSRGVLARLPNPCNTVCVGRLLYGLLDDFEPVLQSIKTCLVHVSLPRNDARVGPGGSLRVAIGNRTGVVPIGLRHGLRPPAEGAHGVMLCKGHRVEVLGVSLEHTILDLGTLDARSGDEVVVLGKNLPLSDFANSQGVSPLTVLMNFDQRLQYNYLDV
jgi:alanine racemase